MSVVATLTARADAASDVHATWFRKALDAGVKMALGSDIRPLKDAALLEMGLWVRDGATPWQRFRYVTMPMLMQQGCKVDLPLSCMPLLEDIGKVQSYSYKLKQILFTETLMATPPTC